MGQIFPVARSPTSNDRSAPSAIVGGLANPASTGVTDALYLDGELLSATRCTLAMFHSGTMADVPMLVPSSPVRIATPPTALRLRHERCLCRASPAGPPADEQKRPASNVVGVSARSRGALLGGGEGEAQGGCWAGWAQQPALEAERGRPR